MRRRPERGFTLTELVVALAVLAFVTSQFLLSFTNQHSSYLDQEKLVDAQQEARLVLDLMLRDLRMAGFMVPKLVGVYAVDGGANGPDTLCVSDPSVMDTNNVEDSNGRFEGASLAAGLGGNAGSVTLNGMDVDGDGNVDFSLGGGILISDEASAHCAVVTNVAGGAVDFDVPTPGGFNVVQDDARAVPALVYRVNANQLRRNSLVLSTLVEDLQVEFAVDEDADGQIAGAEFPIADLAGSTLSRVRRARVTVTARSLRADPDFQGQYAAAANRVAGPADTFRRRRLVGDALLRNMR